MTEALLFTMKKFILLVLIAVFGLQLRAAEQFDELDLRGGWELVSYTGTYDLFTTPYLDGDGDESYKDLPISDCKYLYLEDSVYADKYNYTTDNWSTYIFGISDFNPNNDYNDWFCISGLFSRQGLPSIVDDNDIQIITDYFISNNNKLHIQLPPTSLHFIIESFTDTEMHLKSFDGKFSAHYKRISSPANVNALTVQSTSEEIYNLNGIKTPTLSKGINIIRRGKKVKKNIL